MFEVALQAQASNLTFPSKNDCKINTYRHNSNDNTQPHSQRPKNENFVLVSGGFLLSVWVHSPMVLRLEADAYFIQASPRTRFQVI